MKNFAIILFLFTSIVSISSQEVGNNMLGKIDAIDSHLEVEMEKRQIPGLAYGSCYDGQLIHLGAMGYADLQNQGQKKSPSAKNLCAREL